MDTKSREKYSTKFEGCFTITPRLPDQFVAAWEEMRQQSEGISLGISRRRAKQVNFAVGAFNPWMLVNVDGCTIMKVDPIFVETMPSVPVRQWAMYTIQLIHDLLMRGGGVAMEPEISGRVCWDGDTLEDQGLMSIRIRALGTSLQITTPSRFLRLCAFRTPVHVSRAHIAVRGPAHPKFPSVGLQSPYGRPYLHWSFEPSLSIAELLHIGEPVFATTLAPAATVCVRAFRPTHVSPTSRASTVSPDTKVGGIAERKLSADRMSSGQEFSERFSEREFVSLATCCLWRQHGTVQAKRHRQMEYRYPIVRHLAGWVPYRACCVLEDTGLPAPLRDTIWEYVQRLSQSWEYTANDPPPRVCSQCYRPFNGPATAWAAFEEPDFAARLRECATTAPIGKVYGRYCSLVCLEHGLVNASELWCWNEDPIPPPNGVVEIAALHEPISKDTVLPGYDEVRGKPHPIVARCDSAFAHFGDIASKCTPLPPNPNANEHVQRFWF